MHIAKAFAPITITLETKEDVRELQKIVQGYLRSTESRWGSLSGHRDKDIVFAEYLNKCIGDKYFN